MQAVQIHGCCSWIDGMSFRGRVHRCTARGDPRHQGGEGVAGTPGACSQVFCHPIRCMLVMRYRQRYVINTPSVPQPPQPPTTTGVYPKRAHFFCVCTCHDGPQRAAQIRSCSATQAATTALVVATRAAVDRCSPRHCSPPQLRPQGKTKVV